MTQELCHPSSQLPAGPPTEPPPDYDMPRTNPEPSRRRRSRPRTDRASEKPDANEVNIPVPDYSDDEDYCISTTQETQPDPKVDTEQRKLMIMSLNNSNLPIPDPETLDERLTRSGCTDEDLLQGQQIPNPVRDSVERQQLHKELMHKHKRGDLLPGKSELQKKMDERRVKVELRQKQEELKQNRTSFDKKLEQQALRLEQYEQQIAAPIEEAQTELQKAFEKLKH